MSDEVHDPPPMSPVIAVIYAITLPLGLLALVFGPVGRLTWLPGWVFIAVLVGAFGASAAVIAVVNPMIYRARSRFQPGTKTWDLVLLSIMLPALVAIIPVGTLDAGRVHWSPALPLWVVVSGYLVLVAGIAGTGWAQAVNPFFEPGVRIQTERHQHVIETGPYRYVRHPGYLFALMIFLGLPLALGSMWALVPGAIASVLLIWRTALEDRLLRAELTGYADYAQRVRGRLVPRIW